MRKRGVTLIEIIVASGIFMTLMGIFIGAFITFINVKALAVRMRNSQEKLRVATEMMSRLSRQASDVLIVSTANEKRLVLLNAATNGDGTNMTGAQFVIDAPVDGLSNLYYLECSSTSDCNNFQTRATTLGQNLLGGEFKLTTASNFSRSWVNNNSPYITFKLVGSTGSQTRAYYIDNFTVETGVVAGGVY